MEAVPFDVPAAAVPLVVVAGRAGEAHRPLRVLFDTGAAAPFTVILGRRAAAVVGVRPTGGAPYVTRAVAGGGSIKVEPAQLGRFWLGGIELRDVDAGVSRSIDTVAAQLPPPGIDARVGQVFVRGRIVRIDYPARTIDFAAAPGSDAAAVPMTLAPIRPLSLVSVRINGRGPFTMALDTGAVTNLLSPAAAARAGVSRRGPDVLLSGAGGEASRGVASRAHLQLGPKTWKAAPVVISDMIEPVAEESGAPIDGVLGARLFTAGRLTLDYPGGRIWID